MLYLTMHPDPGPSAAPSEHLTLGRTIPDVDFSAEGTRRLATQTPGGAAPVAPHPPSGLPGTPLDGVPDGHARFEVVGLLGAGGSGEVFSVRDRNLDRLVAVKLLGAGDGPDPEAERGFVEEARLTAVLRHPNVLPVHDLDRSADGRLFFTMSHVEGRALDDILVASRLDARDGRLASSNAIVTAFIAVSQAISFAHNRRILHGDIKPANIMLGDFGEVLVLDWGAAARLDADGRASAKMYGTPLYMSPEQARREGAGVVSDVYCLGATLFHALLLRVPLWRDDLDEFWERKRSGEIDAPTPAERAAVPAPLLAIALKALAPDPAARYPDMGALIRDLEAYQTGLAVSAHRYPLHETAARWLRRHARTALWGVALLVALAVPLLLLFGERLKEIATWGAPILTETFADEGWRARWLVRDGAFAPQGGRLVSTSKYEALVLYRARCAGDTAIEFTGEVLPGSPLCDLSVCWSRDADLEGARTTRIDDLYKLQVGAYDNSYSAIILPDERQVALSPFRLQHGRRYRIRAEIVDSTLRLLVDGRQILSYTDPFPFAGGYIGLYGYYRGKAFSDVSLYALGLPQRLPATVIGDVLAQQRSFAPAAGQYARVSASFPGSGLGREARFREGLCWFRMERYDQAFATWQPLAGTEFDDRVFLQRIDRAFAAGDHPAVLAGLDALARRPDQEVRAQAAVRWATYVYQVRTIPAANQRRELLEAYLRTYDAGLRDIDLAERAAAECFKSVGRPQEILNRFPANRNCCVQALAQLGRWVEIARDYPDQLAVWTEASLRIGEFAALARCSDHDQRAMGLAMLGRGEEALAEGDLEPDVHARVLIALGRYQEALEVPGVGGHWVAVAQIGLGRAQREPPVRVQGLHLLALDQPRALLERCDRGSVDGWGARLLLDLDGRAVGAAPAGPPETPGLIYSFDHVTLSFAGGFMAPFIADLGGGSAPPARPDALTSSCAAIIAGFRWADAQRPWYAARFLTGACSADEFLAQPDQLSVRAWLLALTGMRAERADQPAAAHAAYTAYLALPPQRHGFDPDPIMDRFVAWRAALLAAPSHLPPPAELVH